MSANPETTAPIKNPQISLPDIPALCVNARECAILTDEGELLTLSHKEAQTIIYNKTILVCHAPYTKSRLGFEEFYTFDVLELFAFVHPAKFCVPTPIGIARALNLPVSDNFEDSPIVLMEIARQLLTDLQKDEYGEKADPLKISGIMGLKGKGWGWTNFIFAALGQEYNPKEEIISKSALNVWKTLPEWAEDAPTPPPSHYGVSEKEAHARLEELLNTGDQHTEVREQQKSYTAEITKMLEPMSEDENPHIVLAEAGTGIGKTLGYLAPASVWAEKNEGAVWISTYTKNLQRQIDSELDRLYPNPEVKNAYVAMRKGRENYLCLLNLEDLSAGAALAHNPRHAVAAGIMARWVAATKDGDLSGAQFPGWISGLLGFANTVGLADKRGECIFSACDHYNRCFVERSIRKTKHARIVVANHALVMIQSSISNPMETMPSRYIFDEGHHLFGAADSAFSSHLTAQETAELRRWILGYEGSKKGRARGLKRRIEDLIESDNEAQNTLNEILYHANKLCGTGWSRRFKDNNPNGSTEIFLMQVLRVVYARAQGVDTPYSIETELYPIDEKLLQSAIKLCTELRSLLNPIESLSKIMHKRLEDDNGEMSPDIRKRLDSIISSLDSRACLTLKSWIAMLENITNRHPANCHPVGALKKRSHERDLEQGSRKAADTTDPRRLKEATPIRGDDGTAKGFVDWMEITRIDGKSVDVGLYRHYVDPMKPFSAALKPHLHGMAVTSATLQDQNNNEANWETAKLRSGAKYLNPNSTNNSYKSPFNYAKNTKIFIINDINKNDLSQVSAAYRALFIASCGGALGLFTSIKRLLAVHSKIAQPLESAGVTLYGQHADNMDTGTLIDIFRDDIDSCLLGTDAVRDGVDIPGKSLRLLVFDRTPWPRPTILHKARRKEFGGRSYDEMITRLKLKQAFGRLIRKADDKGVFVMLDSMLPSRLHSAFPEDVDIIKTGLHDTIEQIKEFL